MYKTALITGASKGIGKDLAEEFAKHGYSLILIARTLSELQAIQQHIQTTYPCNCKILSLDLTQSDAVDIIFNTFPDEIAALDVLVNNAGYGITEKFTNMSDQDVNGIIALNMTILTQLTHRVLKRMVANQRGKILNVASTAAFAPGPYMAMYYASKAYVLSFSQSLYEEFRKDGITVSALCPGVTQTAFQARAGMEKTGMMSGILPIMTSSEVASIAFRGLMKKQRVIITGFSNKIAIFLMWLTPTWLNLKIIALLDKPKNSTS